MGRRALTAVALIAAAALALVGLPVPTPAAAGPVDDCNTWWDRGAGTDSWHDALNWSDDTVPGTGDVVCIGGGDTVMFTTGTTSISAAEVNGKLYIGGGSLAIGAAIEDDSLFTDLTIDGGTLTGAGTLTVTGGFTWKGGELAGSGTLDLTSTVTASISQPAAKTLGRHLRNAGSLTWSDGDIVMRSDGDRHPHLDNAGTFTISGDDTAYRGPGSTIPEITNRAGATIRKTGAGAAKLGDTGSQFGNDGTVEAAGGTLWIDAWLTGFGGSDLTVGTWRVADNATLKLLAADIVTNSADISLLGPNARFLDQDGADALRHFATNSGTLTLAGGRDLAVPGDLGNNATLKLGAGSVVTVPGDFYAGNGRLEVDVAATTPGQGHGSLTVSGTAYLGGTLAANVVAPFVPAPSDEFTIVDAAALSGPFASIEGGLFVHYDAAAGNAVLGATDPFAGCTTVYIGATSNWHDAANWSGGEIPSGDDSACIPAGVTVNHYSGSSGVNALRVDGTLVMQGGTLTIWGASSNSGTIHLGGDSEIDIHGDYTQAPSGRLEVELYGNVGGHGYGRLVVNGSANLAGTLSSTLVGGFTPGATDAFTVIDAAGIAGTFTAEGTLVPSYDSANGDVVLSLTGGGPACTVTWDGGGGNGRWDTAANWSTDALPSASDVACIPEGATVNHASGDSTVGGVNVRGTLTVSGGTLAIAGESTIAVLNVSGGVLGGAGNVTVGGQFNWTNGTVSGAGTLTVGPAATASISTGNTKYLERHLLNTGSLAWSDGNLILHSGGHLDNAATFTITSGYGAQWFDGGTAPKITNQPGATITKTATTTATLGSSGVEFTNNGTITAAEGTLKLESDVTNVSGTTLDGGTWSVADGATLRLRNANVVTNAADISLLGPGANFLDHNGADALRNLAVNDGELLLAGKNLSLGGNLTNSGALTLKSAQIALAGDFTQTGAPLAGDAGLLEIEVSGPVPGVGFGRIVASGAATVDGRIVSTLANGYTPGPADSFTVIDASSLSGTFAAVEGDLDVDYDVANGDVILGTALSSCTVSWDGSAGDGRWDTAANWSTDNLPGPSDAVCIPEGSAVEHSTGTSSVGAVTAEGAVTVSGGTLSIAGDSTIAQLAVSGGTLDGSGAVAVQDQFAWSGGALAGSGDLRLGSSATGSITNDVTLGRHLVNEGTLTWDSGATSGEIRLVETADATGHLDNLATFDIGTGETAYSASGSSAPRITNRPGATITKTTAGVSSLAANGAVFVNDGTVHANAGLLIVGGAAGSGGSGAWIADANLDFSQGTLDLTGPVTGAGTMFVTGATVGVTGSSAFTPAHITVQGGTLDLDNTPVGGNTTAALTISGGTLAIGSASRLQVGGPFTQSGTGRLEFTIAGTDPGTTHGRLDVSGAATIDGTLAATLADGYTPGAADEFVVIDAATLSGTFASVEGTLSAVYDPPNGTVTLRAGVPPVPPTVTISPQSTPEAVGTFQVQVQGIGGTVPVTVPFQVTAGTAQATLDYSTASTPATVTVNPDSSAFVAVTITADTIDEDDETFTVTAGEATAAMTIVDDDAAPMAVIDGISITEGDGGTVDAALAVRLVDPVLGLLPQESAKVVTVAASTHDGTALAGPDYVEAAGDVVFAPGETTKIFAVPIVGDEIDEDDEQFSATITAAGNVTVPEGESATVTIVDDDGPSGSGTVAEQLETGGSQLFDVLDDWGAEYDLDRNTTSPFELPGLTDELAGLYEPQDDLDRLDSPFSGLDDDLDVLCGQLEAQGVTIDWVAGGACGHPAPPTAADIIQVRYTATLADLAESLGFTGDEFNDDATGFLDGLASNLGLDADFDSSADLVVTLVVGVDTTGFYVADESGLRLDVDATTTVGGTGSVAGVAGLDVTGPVAVDVSVILAANGGPARLRAADLAAAPASYLRPAAEGTVDAHLDATLDPLALGWDSTFTLSVDPQFQTDIDIAASLEGTLTLPGLTDAANTALIDMVGAYDNGVWTLSGTGEAGHDYAWAGFGVADLAFGATLAPDRFDGSATANLDADLGAAGGAVTVGLAGSFDHTRVQTTGHVAVDELTLPIAYLGGVTLDATVDGDVATGTATGSVAVNAATVVLFPETAPPGTVPAGSARADAVTGTLDSTGNLSLHAGTVTGSIAGAIDFTISDVDLHLGPAATGPVFTAATATGALRGLDGLGVTFTDLALERDGTFGASGVEVTSAGLLQTIGLGGIVPFDVTGVSLNFPDWGNLDTFEVTVTGSVDFTAMAGLPFTPVLGIGGAAVTPSSPTEDNTFTFSIAVDSLSEGKVRPWDLGPITLGFDDLRVGDVTLGAQLTLGAYQNGAWVNDACGSLSVLGGLDDIRGEAAIDVCGSLGITPAGASLDLDGTFSLSASLGDNVSFEGAELDFGLGIAVDGQWRFTITGPTFTGAGVDRVEIAFGEFMRVVGTNVGINFAPAPGQPLVTFGGRPCEADEDPPCDGSARVEFDEDFDALAGWGGEVGNFAIGADLVPRVLPGFFFNLDVPDDEHFGLPDWLPLRIDDFGIRFPNVDLTDIPPEGIPLTDLAGFVITFSGGIEANDTWPISASVDGLEVDLGKLARGEFPITNLTGAKMGVEPFELVPGFEVGGGLELKTISVDGDPAPGEQPETVFYGRVFGQFEYEGMGAGIDLVVTQYGPILAQVLVPLAIPLDGGLLGGVMLSGVEGGLAFGGPAFPDPQRPMEILHDPAFETDFPINDDTIREKVEPAVQTGSFTWDDGFTMALSGKLTHAMAPGIVTGDVTLGMNVGLIPGRQGVKFIGSGNIAAWGMDFAGAALLMDLSEPLEPKFDFAFETPQPGNPLGFLLPAHATLEASLDTKGILPGFGLGVATFVQRAASGSLEVGQDFFDASLGALATGLQGDHERPLARLLLDTNGDGLVSGAEDGQVVTREFLTSRAIALMGGGALPADPAAAGRAARMFVADLLNTGSDLVDDFDLSAVFTHADYVAFAQQLGAGGEAIAALFGVVRDAVREAGAGFWSQFDPSFHLRGMLQPVILGIPFGEPQHEVEAIITKDGLGFGFDTSIADIGTQLCGMVIPVIGGAACELMSLGFEDHLGMTFELPIGGVIEGLFGGSGVPTIDPWSGAWAIELRGGLRWLDFEVGQMTGLVIAADNPALVDAHVQKLWEDPNASVDPNRIPIRTEQHYLDIVGHGGILLTGRLLLPELLTDPLGLLSTLNLQVPADIADMPDWVSAIADHLGRTTSPTSVQLFVPGFGDVFRYDFGAVERISPIGVGNALADAFNDISAAAYLEGVFDGTLLSVPFGRAVVTSSDQKTQVRGELPLIGLSTRFDLDVEPTLGRDGTVDLPRATATTSIDAADVDDVLARLGLPPIIGGVAGADATFRAVSPGYDPSSADPLLRKGGIELGTRLDIEGLVDDAAFRIAVTPPSGGGLPDLVGHAEVAQIGPLGGVTISDASIDVVQTDGHLGVGVDGRADILGAAARVHGTLNPDLTGSLAVTFDGGGPTLAGFDISTGFVLGLTRSGGTLVATLSFDGTVGFPSWLSAATGKGSAHATGTIASDGTIDISLDISSLSLFGFTLRDGTFRVVGNAGAVRMVVDTGMSFLGANLDVDGNLAIGSGGPTGTLTVALQSGRSLAFGPVAVRGSLSLVVGTTSASLAATGAADIPGVATGVGISGSISSAGTGNLALTASSLGIKGFNVTRLTTGNPRPPLATITRTVLATSMTVDARFNFLGSSLDVDGALVLAAAGPTGSLALTLNGSPNIPFGGWRFEGGVTMAFTPTTAAIAVNSRVDVPGIADNLALSGSLDTTLRGSLTVSAGSLRLGPPGSALSISGTFTLSRLGSPAVISFTATDVTLAWAGVTSFSVNTFSIGTDGHFDASVTAKTVTVSQFSLALPSFNLHVGANGTGIQLQVGPSSLTITNLGTLTVPGVNIDTTGEFSLTLASTHLDLRALDLDGRLIFERQGGVFRLRVTGTTRFNKPTVAIPGLATLTVDAFTISSDGTFDVAASTTRIGPDALSIRNASIRVRKTGASLSTLGVRVNGGRLYLPVGDPIDLPNFTIDGDAEWSYTFTATGINLGPALQTTNDPSFTLSLSGGVLGLSLNSPIGIDVLAGSIGMSLRTLTVASDGRFEGSVRGRLAALGYVFAQATYDVSLDNGVVRMAIPASDPVTVDLGPVDGSVSGSVYSDGTFSFDGTAAVDLTLFTVGLKGTATVRFRTDRLTGSFTGQACAGVCIDVVGGSINRNGVLRLVIAGIVYRIQLFAPPQ
ncbi:MAG: Calx-beta domain-containing protein [Acidimicrobiia bacterium]